MQLLAAQHFRSRRVISVIAAIGCALTISACGSSSSSKGGSDWMVKVSGNFANIYLYPEGTHPGASERVNLGPSGAKDQAAVTKAAGQLGVPAGNVTNVSGL
jgi:hypothetical protein